MKRKTLHTSIVLLFGVFLWFTTANAQNERIRINGYSSFEFEYQFGDKGEGDQNGSFDADLFDLVLNVRATDRLRVAADITWEHGAATEDGRGNAAVEYAFGEYSVNDLLKIRAGKMFTHFGIYNEIHTAKPAFLTVKEPLSTNKNSGFGSKDRFYPRWVTGLAITGDGTISEEMDFDYILQVTNGEQEVTNPFEEDNNGQKAISGRFRITPVEDLQLGASFYMDQLTEYELDSEGEFVLDDDDPIDTGERKGLFSYGIQAEWSKNDLGLEFEFVGGSLSPSSATVGADISRNALTAMVFYHIQEKYTPYFRYEQLDPNSDVKDDEASMLVYGINTQIDEGLFFKIELNTVSSGDSNAEFGGKNYTELKAAIAIGF